MRDRACAARCSSATASSSSEPRSTKAGPIFEEAIEIFTELDDTMRLAWATFFLGRAELVRDNENCAIHMTAAVDMFRALRIPIGEAWAVIYLGAIAEMDGDLDRAGEAYGRARDIAMRMGHKSLEGSVIGELAGIAIAQGDLDRARTQLREAIELQHQTSDLYSVAPHICDLAQVEILAGDIPAARALTIEAIRAGVDNDDEWVLNEALLLLAVVLAEEGSPRDARRVVAATGWDVDPPEGLRDYTKSNLRDGPRPARTGPGRGVRRRSRRRTAGGPGRDRARRPCR